MKINSLKRIVTLILLLLSSITVAQVQKLNKLSSAKFISSKIIYDDNTDDVYGYFILYLNDKKSKNFVELEYVVLDNNLNKITSNTFNQVYFSDILNNPEDLIKLDGVKKIKEDLFFFIRIKRGINDLADVNRKVNLKNFKLSDEFVITNHKLENRTFSIGEKVKINDYETFNGLLATKGDYFINFGNKESVSDSGKKKKVRTFTVFDNDFKALWDIEIPDPKKDYLYLDSDSDVFLMYYGKAFDFSKNDLAIFDYRNGLIANYLLKDSEYKFQIEKVDYDKNQIILLVNLYKKNASKFDSEKILGFGKIILDKKTGKEIGKKIFLWEDFKPYLNVKNKYGELKQKGYGKLFLQDFVNLKNGNTILILEGYKVTHSSKILDLFVVELDKNFKIEYFKETEKVRSKTKSIKYTGRGLKNANKFDYLYSQNLDGKDSYTFFYVNNERDGWDISKRLDPQWVLGIITYADGEFNYDKLTLTTEKGVIIPAKAKKGHILLFESEDDDVELRLEKVNY